MAIARDRWRGRQSATVDVMVAVLLVVLAVELLAVVLLVVEE